MMRASIAARWRRAAQALGNAIPARVAFAAKLTVAGVALAIIGGMADWGRFAALGAALALPLIAGTAIGLALTVPLAWRWSLLLWLAGGERFPVSEAYRGYLIGAFFGIFLPGGIGGDVARAQYAAAPTGLGFARSLAVVVNERLFGLFSLCIFLSCGVALNPSLLGRADTSAFRMALVVAAIAGIAVVVGAMIRRYIELPLRKIPALLALSLVGQSIDFLVVALYARFLGVVVTMADILIIVPFVFIATILPISPGGLGVREGALTALLVLAGVPAAAAATIALMLLATKIAISLFGAGLFLAGRRSGALLERRR